MIQFQGTAVFSFVLLMSAATIVSAHTRLTYPTPRNSNSGIKSGPCGGLLPTVSPTIITGGQPLTITWEETINHPGKFLFALATANDADFQSHPLAVVIDTQNDGQTPHTYATTVTIPNMNCDTCSIQLIQSMEENPNAPTYYYSCADVKIVAVGTTAGASPVQGQGVSVGKAAPSMAGCGLVKSDDLMPPPPSMKLVLLIALLFLIPPTLIITLRGRAIPVRLRNRNRRF